MPGVLEDGEVAAVVAAGGEAGAGDGDGGPALPALKKSSRGKKEAAAVPVGAGASGSGGPDPPFLSPPCAAFPMSPAAEASVGVAPRVSPWDVRIENGVEVGFGYGGSSGGSSSGPMASKRKLNKSSSDMV